MRSDNKTQITTWQQLHEDFVQTRAVKDITYARLLLLVMPYYIGFLFALARCCSFATAACTLFLLKTPCLRNSCDKAKNDLPNSYQMKTSTWLRRLPFTSAKSPFPNCNTHYTMSTKVKAIMILLFGKQCSTSQISLRGHSSHGFQN